MGSCCWLPLRLLLQPLMPRKEESRLAVSGGLSSWLEMTEATVLVDCCLESSFSGSWRLRLEAVSPVSSIFKKPLKQLRDNCESPKHLHSAETNPNCSGQSDKPLRKSSIGQQKSQTLATPFPTIQGGKYSLWDKGFRFQDPRSRFQEPRAGRRAPSAAGQRGARGLSSMRAFEILKQKQT